MVDIAEGSTLIVKLGEQGKLELVKIIPPVPPSELVSRPLIIGLDQIEPELMAKLFTILFEEMDAQLSESKLTLPHQLPVKTPHKYQLFPGLPELEPEHSDNHVSLQRAFELFLNHPEELAKLLTSVRDRIILLRDDEFMARLGGSSKSEQFVSGRSPVGLEKFIQMAVEMIDESESHGGNLGNQLEGSAGFGANFDAVTFRTIIQEVAIGNGEKETSNTSSGNSILEILKAAILWLRNQSLVPGDRAMANFISKLGALIDYGNADSMDFETLRPLLAEVRILASKLLVDDLPRLKDLPSFNPKVVRVLEQIEKFIGRLQEIIESSQQDGGKRKPKSRRYGGDFGDLATAEVRNRVLEQFRVLERLNTSLFLDGRILFCLPFIVKGNPEPFYGELRKCDNENEEDVETGSRNIRPDIRFEVDFRKLGSVLGLIFMKRKRVFIFFDNEESLRFCSGSLGLLGDELGKGWNVQFEFKVRHLNKNVTA
jgi:hypothetical protein